MSDASGSRGGLAVRLISPLLLILLAGGLIVLGWSLAPTHSVEKYLNLVFMDDLRTNGQNAGLRILEKEIGTGETEQETYPAGKVTYPTFGEQYAVLEAKSVNINVGVFYGSNAELLERGACQSTQSAVLGTDGNTVIDAHVNSYFADLTKLAVGDKVVLYTEYGRFTYRVSRAISFLKSDRRWINSTNDDVLTLYTCEADLLGDSDQRVGVRCELVAREFFEPLDAG